jgi:multidrug efflux pump subunit AcrA (membrane-fusion protein)
MKSNQLKKSTLAITAILTVLSSSVQAWQLMTVESAEFGNKIKIGGTVIPYKEVTLSAQVPGRVQYIAGSEGDFFQKNNLLLSIDDDDLVARRRAALAQLSNAESALRNARVQYSRELISPRTESLSGMPGLGMPTLFDNMFTKNMGNMMGVGNPDIERYGDLYSSGAQVQNAESMVMKARSGLEELDAKLRDARAIAPFDGKLVRKMVEEGDTVQPGTPLLKFAHTQYLRIQAEVPARLIFGLTKGSLVDVKLDINNSYTKAKVAQIYPVADQQKHTVTVKFDLPEGTPGGPGLYAEVTINDTTADRRLVPVIPKDAVIYRGSLPSVYILDEENKAKMRIVRLGSDYDESRVTVLSGIKSGDRIISEPPKTIKSGWQPEVESKTSNSDSDSQ